MKYMIIVLVLMGCSNPRSACRRSYGLFKAVQVGAFSVVISDQEGNKYIRSAEEWSDMTDIDCDFVKWSE